MVGIRRLAWPTPSLTQTPQQKDGPDETCVAFRGVCVPGESRLPDPLTYGKPAIARNVVRLVDMRSMAAAVQGAIRPVQPDYVPYIPKDYSKQVEPAGPPTAAYAYPYYTVRGPRDFFLNEPSTIGY